MVEDASFNLLNEKLRTLFRSKSGKQRQKTAIFIHKIKNDCLWVVDAAKLRA